MLGVNNECLSFTPALRNLALAEGDREHHANVAEVARDIFVERCYIRNLEKKVCQNESQKIIKVSRDKIKKRLDTEIGLGIGNGISYGLAIPAVIIAPITAPILLIPAGASLISYLRVRKINVKEEERKIWVYENFPEATMCKGIEKKCYNLLEKIEKRRENLTRYLEVQLKRKHSWVNLADEERMDYEAYEQEMKEKLAVLEPRDMQDIKDFQEYLIEHVYTK